MVPERLRRALEPFEPVYTPQDDGSTHVHIPGSNSEWLFHAPSPGNTLVESRFVGDPQEGWFRDGDATWRTRQITDATPNSEFYLPQLVHEMVFGERNHQRAIHPREQTDQEKKDGKPAPWHLYHLRVGQESANLGNGKFAKHVHTHLNVNARQRYRLSTHPDHTALTADQMPERIQDGANSVLQGHMPPDVLLDELLDHHEAHPQQFARQFACAVRVCNGS